MKNHALVPAFRDNMKFIRDLSFVQDVRYQPKGTILGNETETRADHTHIIYFIDGAELTISQFMHNGEFRYFALFQVSNLVYNAITTIDLNILPTTVEAVQFLKAIRKSKVTTDVLALFFEFIKFELNSCSTHVYTKIRADIIREFRINQSKEIHAAEAVVHKLRHQIESSPEFILINDEMKALREQMDGLQARLNNLVAKQSTLTDPIKAARLETGTLIGEASLRIPFPFIK